MLPRKKNHVLLKFKIEKDRISFKIYAFNIFCFPNKSFYLEYLHIQENSQQKLIINLNRRIYSNILTLCELSVRCNVIIFTKNRNISNCSLNKWSYFHCIFVHNVFIYFYCKSSILYRKCNKNKISIYMALNIVCLK